MAICKYCKSHNIVQFSEVTDIDYKGTILHVPMEYSVCARCDREFVSKEQILINDANGKAATNKSKAK